MNSEIDQLLHDADRKVMGANFARRVGDCVNAAAMDRDAMDLYRQALNADIYLQDPAWKWTGNRDDNWLRGNGFARIAALSIGADDEMTPHLFNSRTQYEPGDDRDIWCKDCEYHRDHEIHSAARTPGDQP